MASNFFIFQDCEYTHLCERKGMLNLHYEICTNLKQILVKIALIDSLSFALKNFFDEICPKCYLEVCTKVSLP